MVRGWAGGGGTCGDSANAPCLVGERAQGEGGAHGGELEGPAGDRTDVRSRGSLPRADFR